MEILELELGNFNTLLQYKCPKRNLKNFFNI